MIAARSNLETTALPADGRPPEAELQIQLPASPIGRRANAALRAVTRTPAWLLLVAIRGYQRFVSPALPVVTLGACACRFYPSCSHYAAEAVRVHGAITGSLLAVRRLLKCTPLHPGGFDPVPPRPRPACRPTTPAQSSLSL